MVINHSFQDIFESLKETKELSLPVCRENALKLNFTSSQEHKTIYNSPGPLLPFAASEVFHAPVYKWRRMTVFDENCKSVYEISFNICGSNFNFGPGDTIGIIPQNSQTEVNFIINHLSLKDIADLSYTLSMDSRQKAAKIPSHLPVESTLKYVLTNCVDLRGILKKLFLLALLRHTKDENEKRILEYLCSKEGSVAYTKHILNRQICLLDLFAIFKSCKPPIEIILEHLPRLLPRPYSILNSGHNDVNLIKICFSVADVSNNRRGITTGWLEEILLKHDDVEEKMKNLNLGNEECKIPIYMRKNINEFRLPQYLETPIILIGAGTGVSPYIGFLEEREHLHKINPEVKLGYAWLFFGCRNPKLDFIYKDEFEYFQSNGILNRLTTSFSRYNDADIRYVQDAIKENGEELVKLITQGAYVYVCGDIKDMATSVRDSIVHNLAKYGNKSDDEAKQFVSNMVKEKQYLIDIWS